MWSMGSLQIMGIAKGTERPFQFIRLLAQVLQTTSGAQVSSWSPILQPK
jgi:hypothetical protein